MLAAWDMNGKPLWTTDIGVIDSGWFFDPDIPVGTLELADHSWRQGHRAGRSAEGFVHRGVRPGDRQAAMAHRARRDLDAGARRPSFGDGAATQIVTNGPKIRSYDPSTGKLLWTLGPNSEVTVGTPVVGNGLVYVTGGYPPARPVYAIKPNASGDISLPKDKTSNEAIAWSNSEGTYIPTPLFYDGILYTCSNNGVADRLRRHDRRADLSRAGRGRRILLGVADRR